MLSPLSCMPPADPQSPQRTAHPSIHSSSFGFIPSSIYSTSTQEDLVANLLAQVDTIPAPLLRNALVTIITVFCVAVGSLLALAVGFLHLSSRSQPAIEAGDSEKDGLGRSKIMILYCFLMVLIGVHAVVCLSWITIYTLRLFRRQSFSRFHRSVTAYIDKA
ncbi:hypothetical protein BC830DRAFT_417040 [Chytriomyces sp. MP71]|nr:hypothetical protein BC830DRAFT_417040 [Chytriomyces sp. MP71]